MDDGSTDGMAAIARRFARDHQGVLVLSRPERGGKSSALNLGLRYASAEIVIGVDTDSKLGDNAIWEIVQPFRNERVGAVSGTIKVWNSDERLITRLQAYEYRQSIFIGRMMHARLGTLGIVSGAFGAFRRSVLEQLGGWDAGSGEDGDLTLRVRKAGYHITVASYAECRTNAPTTWRQLFRQRLRWDRAVITFECRKHVDFGHFWAKSFRWRDFLLVLDRWFFNVVCVFTFCGYFVWLSLTGSADLVNVVLLLYLCQLGIEIVQAAILLFYSDDLPGDLMLLPVIPVFPLYQAFIKVADLTAILDETFLRKSYVDNYVPKKVRDVTWHW